MLVFSSGSSASQFQYRDVLARLVKKGFIVAALEHPYRDGRVVIGGQPIYSDNFVKNLSITAPELSGLFEFIRIMDQGILSPFLKYVPGLGPAWIDFKRGVEGASGIPLYELFQVSNQEIAFYDERPFERSVLTKVDDTRHAIAYLDAINQQQFANKIDFQRMVMAGHSQGGQTTAILSSNSIGLESVHPIRAAILYDVRIFDGLPPITFEVPHLAMLASSELNAGMGGYYADIFASSPIPAVKNKSAVIGSPLASHTSFLNLCSDQVRENINRPVQVLNDLIAVLNWLPNWLGIPTIPKIEEDFLELLIPPDTPGVDGSVPLCGEGPVNFETMQVIMADYTYDFAMNVFSQSSNLPDRFYNSALHANVIYPTGVPEYVPVRPQIEHRSTPANSMGGVNAMFLDRHYLSCDGDRAINQFRLVRPSAVQIRYDYQCAIDHIAQRSAFRSTGSKQSGPLNNGFGHTQYLDKHNIECHNKPIKSFGLKREGVNWYYAYTCGTVAVESEVTRHTPWNTLPWTGDHIFLDRHDVRCDNNQVLTRVQLQTKEEGFWPWEKRLKMRYEFQCGKPPRYSDSSDFLQWSHTGSFKNLDCTRWHESADPNGWNNNYLCAQENIGLQWSSAGQIEGMRCEHVYEPADPHTWNDNYLCVPKNSRYHFTWSSRGKPTNSGTCIQITEPEDPHTWNDNYLCYFEKTPEQNPSFQWSYAGVLPQKTCTRWLETMDPHTWRDNYLCSQENIGMKWNSSGPIDGMRCTQILEPEDPHTWHDNYMCVPPRTPYEFTWLYAGKPLDHDPDTWSCVQIAEPSDPHGWNDNYLCYKKSVPLFVELFNKRDIIPLFLSRFALAIERDSDLFRDQFLDFNAPGYDPKVAIQALMLLMNAQPFILTQESVDKLLSFVESVALQMTPIVLELWDSNSPHYAPDVVREFVDTMQASNNPALLAYVNKFSPSLGLNCNLTPIVVMGGFQVLTPTPGSGCMQ